MKTEQEWASSCEDIDHKFTPTHSSLVSQRPQERQLMRPWLWERLEKEDVNGKKNLLFSFSINASISALTL